MINVLIVTYQPAQIVLMIGVAVTIVELYANHVVFVANLQKTLVVIVVNPYAKVKNAHKYAIIAKNISVILASGIIIITSIGMIHVAGLVTIVARDALPTKFQ
jgi:hypothetical protein